MKTIKSLMQDLDRASDIPSLRIEIADAILGSLSLKKNDMQDWEKTHFSNAVGAFSLNIHSRQQPTHAWLRLCLLDLEQAIVPSAQHDPGFQCKDPSVKDVTYERLSNALHSIRRDLVRQAESIDAIPSSK